MYQSLCLHFLWLRILAVSNILQLQTMLQWIILCVFIFVLLEVYLQGKFTDKEFFLVGKIKRKHTCINSLVWDNQIPLHKGCSNLHFHGLFQKFLFSHSLAQKMSSFLIFANLKSAEGYLRVISAWISLMSEAAHFFTWLRATFWRRQWHPTPVLLPGKSHGQRSLVGCSPWGR